MLRVLLSVACLGAVVVTSQLHQITLNKADPSFQMLTLANGQRVRIFPIPIQKSRVLHFKARKDGQLYRDKDSEKVEKQAVFEPLPKSFPIKRAIGEARGEAKTEETVVEVSTTTATTTRPPTTVSTYRGVAAAALKDFLVPMVAERQAEKEAKEAEVEGSGSGDDELSEKSTVKTIEAMKPAAVMAVDDEKPLTVDKSDAKKTTKKAKKTPKVISTFSAEEEELLTLTPDVEIKANHTHVHTASHHKDVAKMKKAKNQTTSTMVPLPGDAHEYVLDHVTSHVAHEITHSPNKPPVLKINDKVIVLPKMKTAGSTEDSNGLGSTTSTSARQTEFVGELPHDDIHISPNATVAEIKNKIRSLNSQLLELQEFVHSKAFVPRRRARMHAATTVQGDPIGMEGSLQSSPSSNQVTAFVPLPNGDVQKFYLNPAQMGQISSPVASGPQITLGQSAAGMNGGVLGAAGVPFGGAGSFTGFNGGAGGFGNPYLGALQGSIGGNGYVQPGQYSLPGGGSSYAVPPGFSGIGGVSPYGSAAGFSGAQFGVNPGLSGVQAGGATGMSPNGQSSQGVPPPILEIKVPPPPKVDIPGCYINDKGFVCCNQHLENVINNVMEQISAKAKEKEALTGKPSCNLQASANLLQKQAESVFGVSFESLVSPTDFASRTRFMDDLMCKTEIDGKHVIMYATPVPYPISRRR